ncbi:hypothetical protein AB1N83_008737 [Pleurotus pulmonarius]
MRSPQFLWLGGTQTQLQGSTPMSTSDPDRGSTRNHIIISVSITNLEYIIATSSVVASFTHHFTAERTPRLLCNRLSTPQPTDRSPQWVAFDPSPNLLQAVSHQLGTSSGQQTDPSVRPQWVLMGYLILARIYQLVNERRSGGFGGEHARTHERRGNVERARERGNETRRRGNYVVPARSSCSLHPSSPDLTIEPTSQRTSGRRLDPMTFFVQFEWMGPTARAHARSHVCCRGLRPPPSPAVEVSNYCSPALPKRRMSPRLLLVFEYGVTGSRRSRAYNAGLDVTPDDGRSRPSCYCQLGFMSSNFPIPLRIPHTEPCSYKGTYIAGLGFMLLWTPDT